MPIGDSFDAQLRLFEVRVAYYRTVVLRPTINPLHDPVVVVLRGAGHGEVALANLDAIDQGTPEPMAARLFPSRNAWFSAM